MSAETAHDAIIVGAGQAGPALASRLTGAGMKVAFVERNLIGGTCVNTGCTPTKTLVASAYAAHLARRTDLGVEVTGEIRVDLWFTLASLATALAVLITLGLLARRALARMMESAP